MENLCEDIILLIISDLSVKDIATLHYTYSQYYRYESFICRLEKLLEEIGIDMYSDYIKLYEQENYEKIEQENYADDFYIWDPYVEEYIEDDDNYEIDSF